MVIIIAKIRVLERDLLFVRLVAISRVIFGVGVIRIGTHLVSVKKRIAVI